MTNIESIFNTLEIANILGKLPGHKAEEISIVIDSLKELIVKTIELTVKFPCHGGRIEGPEPYVEFSKLIKHLREVSSPTNSVAVITFNYDIAVDMAIYRAGMGPDYGIPPRPQYSSNPVPLLKLHGSLNWASTRTDRIIRPLLLEEYFAKYTFTNYYNNEITLCEIPIGSHLKEYFTNNTDIEVESKPVIVPPTWNKADQQQALSKVWAKAASELEEAEYIFIIGYSLPETDAFFRLLYALGTVGKKPLKKIVVYNPDDSAAIVQRFRNMIGPGAEARYEYQPLTFEDAISEIKRYFPARS